MTGCTLEEMKYLLRSQHCYVQGSDVYALLLGSISAGASMSVDVIDYN